MTTPTDPGARARMAGRRLAEPLEALAQHVARQVVELVVEALDVNAVLDRVDVNRLLDRVDVDRLVARVDVDSILERTEFRSLLSRSSSTIASEGVDLVRSQAVGLDEFIARLVSRLRRRGYAGPPALPGSPPSLQGGQ